MNLSESTQFFIKEAAIQSKGGPIAIANLIEEIHFYDNLLLPVSSGEVVITDTAKLIERLRPENDTIQFYITKSPNSDIATFKKTFTIYSITNRKNLNNSSESYIIHFVANELIVSKQNKIAKGFKGKYSKFAQDILTDKRIGLGLDLKQIGRIEESSGIRRIIPPNIPALSTLEWCAKRALNTQNVPDFVFFSNVSGYNFCSLSRLLTQDPILDITFAPKNLEPDSSFSELSRARAFEVLSQTDTLTRLENGVDSGVFIGFDPITRTMGELPISGDQTFNSMKHANDNQIGSTIINKNGTSNKTNFNANQVLSVNSKNQRDSKYVKKKNPTIISENETQELFLQQRRAILSRLMEKRIRIVMPGNFQLSSGYIVNIVTPGFGASTRNEDPGFDRSLTGRYIITGTRHIISLRRQITIIEVATDSTIDNRKLSTTQGQIEAMKVYSKITGAK
jgi:hypothetical protein